MKKKSVELLNELTALFTLLDDVLPHAVLPPGRDMFEPDRRSDDQKTYVERHQRLSAFIDNHGPLHPSTQQLLSATVVLGHRVAVAAGAAGLADEIVREVDHLAESRAVRVYARGGFLHLLQVASTQMHTLRGAR